MKLARLDNFNRFCELKEEWDELLRSQVDTVFLMHDWLNQWWRHYHEDSELWTLVARDTHGLAGVVPLMLQRDFGGLRRLSFMGAGEVTPNHLDIIARPDTRGAVEEMLSEYLCQSSSQWDVLDLDKLPSDRGTAERLRLRLGARGLVARTEVSARCGYAELPNSFDTYLQGRGSTTRRDLRLKRRRLDEAVPGVRFVIASTPEEVERVLSALVQMHQARWRRRGYPGSFATERFIRFQRGVALSALRDGYLRLYSLQGGAQILAVGYAFRVGDCVQGYISSFDERRPKLSVGMISVAGAIEQAILEGARRFDLLEGEEPYKRHWATHVRENVRLRAFSPHWRGKLARVATETGTALFQSGVRYLPIGIRRPLRQALMRFQAARQSRGDSISNGDQG